MQSSRGNAAIGRSDVEELRTENTTSDTGRMPQGGGTLVFHINLNILCARLKLSRSTHQVLLVLIGWPDVALPMQVAVDLTVLH